MELVRTDSDLGMSSPATSQMVSLTPETYAKLVAEYQKLRTHNKILKKAVLQVRIFDNKEDFV
jgi:hypothetical protein